MAIPIEANVGVANVEALKQAWHSLSRACAVCTLEKGLASCRAISMVGRVLASSQLEVDATDLPECLHQPGPDFSYPKHSFRKKTVIQWSFQHAWFLKWPFLPVQGKEE